MHDARSDAYPMSFPQRVKRSLRIAGRLSMATGLGSIAFAVALVGPVCAQETAITIEPRPGVTMRFLLEAPAKAAGSVILLAGGHGNLDLAEDGRIGWGAGNQLVRTRSLYARAGYVTAAMDIASDHKLPGSAVAGYRWSEAHATDIGALVQYLRKVAPPVYLVGTSRAALSVANAAVRLSGDARPDAIVVTAGMLMERTTRQPNVQRSVGALERVTVPTLLVHHERDECSYTPAADVEPFARLLTQAPTVEVRMLRGGYSKGDPCEAWGHHGFAGIDGEVVMAVTGWLKSIR